MTTKPFFESCPQCKQRDGMVKQDKGFYWCQHCNALFHEDDTIETSPIAPLLRFQMNDDPDRTTRLITPDMLQDDDES